MQKNWQQNIFVKIVSIYFVPSECKNISSQTVSVIFPREFEFSLLGKFRDLFTSDDVISVFACRLLNFTECFNTNILRYDLLFRGLRFQDNDYSLPYP